LACRQADRPVVAKSSVAFQDTSQSELRNIFDVESEQDIESKSFSKLMNETSEFERAYRRADHFHPGLRDLKEMLADNCGFPVSADNWLDHEGDPIV
jgi:hypothetical protein